MKRRDFLKSVTAGGAIATLTNPISAVSAMLRPTMDRQPDGRTKWVFISDLHMNAHQDSAWLNEHIPDLAAFINGLNARTDVAELVIIGDMLDDWIIPAESPPTSFSDIINAPHNAPVTDALAALCENPEIRVSYITGNHDLLSFEEANKAAIAQAFPQMNIISDAPGLGAYTLDDVLLAEHGHRYSLFNAPDIWSHEGSHLPLGYFISRLSASQSVKEGRIYTTPDVLQQVAHSLGIGARLRGMDKAPYGIQPALQGTIDDALIVAVFSAVALWAGKKPWDLFRMDGLDNFLIDPMVATVTLLYDEILSQWPNRQNIVSPEMALANDIGYMMNTANLLFTMPESIQPYFSFAPRILLFGHTHKPVLWHKQTPQGCIYLNTGTWIDNKPMTYGEINILDTEDDCRTYQASLWYYPESTPRTSASISIPLTA